MKLIFIILAFLFFLVSQIKSLNIYAQQANTDGNFTVSPKLNYVDQNQIGKFFTVSIENNSERDITLIAEEIYVTKESVKNEISLSDEEVNTKLLDFDTNEFTVKANDTKEFQIRVKLNARPLQNSFPAVIFKSVEANESLQREEITIFFLEADGDLILNNQLNISITGITASTSIQITGKISNEGEKIFNPSGSVKIYKNGANIYEKQLTSQIEGLLLPGEFVEYYLEWTNSEQSLSGIGQYTIESDITAAPSGKTFVTKTNIFYIPVQALAVGGASLIVILVLFLLIKRKTKRKLLDPPT